MEFLSNENCEIKIQDGICKIKYLKESYDFDTADQMVKQRLSITKDNSYPMLQDIRQIKNFSVEVRHRFNQEDSKSGVTAVAIIMKSKVQAIISQFYFAIAKLDIPTSFFSNEEDGLLWLEKYKNN